MAGAVGGPEQGHSLRASEKDLGGATSVGPRNQVTELTNTAEDRIDHGDSSRAEYASARSSHPLARGLVAAPVAAAGTGVV